MPTFSLGKYPKTISEVDSLELPKGNKVIMKKLREKK